MRWRHERLTLLLLLVLAACADLPQEPEDPAPLEPESLARSWVISVVPRNGPADITVASDGLTGTGIVDTTYLVGSVSVYPTGQTHDATADIYSNETGRTYWVGAEGGGEKQRARLLGRRRAQRGAGDGLLSHAVSRAVPSALRGLTAVFGMGTGVALSR